MDIKLGLSVLLLAASVLSARAEQVIGKLGQTIQSTPIYRKMSTKAPVLYRSGQYRYLVINSTRSHDWLAVTMIDGSKGYIPSERVAMLPYDVTTGGTRGRTPTAPAPSRSGGSSHLPAVTGSSPGSGGATGKKQEMLEVSYKYIGTPYKWGGENINRGIDCSAFVQQLFGSIGVNLPRTAAEQALVGEPITELQNLQPGDRLYFYDRKRGRIGHTGIFLGFFQDGGAYFIHSSSNNHGVATDDLRVQKWRNMLSAARRDSQVH